MGGIPRTPKASGLWQVCHMAYPRSQLVSDDEPGFFHCVSRCVRRAFLCGRDDAAGKDYEHRRQWIEDRIFKLAESFAVSVYAYAVAQAEAMGRFAEGKKPLSEAVAREQSFPRGFA